MNNDRWAQSKLVALSPNSDHFFIQHHNPHLCPSFWASKIQSPEDVALNMSLLLRLICRMSLPSNPTFVPAGTVLRSSQFPTHPYKRQSTYDLHPVVIPSYCHLSPIWSQEWIKNNGNCVTLVVEVLPKAITAVHSSLIPKVGGPNV